MKHILTYLSICFVFATSAQDIHFSQFTETPLHINPAAAGFYNGYERFILNHKSQWVALNSPFRTTMASFDLPFFAKWGNNAYLGAGVSFYNDMAGDSKFGINQGNLSVAGILPADDRTKISAGIQLGFAQRSGQLESLTWGNQFTGDGFDPTIPSNEVNTLNSFVYADLGAGINFEFDNTREQLDGFDEFRIRLGASAFHLNKPVLKYTNSSNDVIPMKLIGHLEIRWDIPGSTVSLVPRAVCMKQGPHTEINAGTFLRFQLQNGTKYTGLISENALSVGLQIRAGDAIIPMVLLELTDYAIGLSYDVSTSQISTINAAAGGFEITLRYVNLKDALWKRNVQGRRF